MAPNSVPLPPGPAPTAPPLSARERAAGKGEVDGLLVQSHLERLGLAKSPVRPLSARKLVRPKSAGRNTARSTGTSGFRAANAASMTAIAVTGAAKEHQQLLATIEREYWQDLRRIDDDGSWIIDGVSSPEPKEVKEGSHPAGLAESDDGEARISRPNHRVDVAKALGLPNEILDALLAGKCRDSKFAATSERKRRFASFVLYNCAGEKFSLEHSSLGPEAAKAVVMALALCSRFKYLSLSCNGLGDEGAATIGLALKQNQLVEVDLSANDISSKGATAILENLRHNTSVQSLDLSSKPGALRNRLVARANSRPLEDLLQHNRTLTKISLSATGLGPEGASGLARGLVGNNTLLSVDLAGCDVGSKGAVFIAEALRSCSLEELNLSENHVGDEGLLSLANALGALPLTAEEAKKNPAWVGPEAIKATSKYMEALSTLKREIADVTLSDLKEATDTEHRRNGLAKVREAAANLMIAVRDAEVKLPRLKVLQLANNVGTKTGYSRLEDALQANYIMERMNLDHNDHGRGNADGSLDSIIICLAANTTLRHLNLGNCNLSRASLINISKALAVNKGLCTLSFAGNIFDVEAASMLGATLGGGGVQALKFLNLSSCHLDDAAGAKLAAGLATNHGLETLMLRNNCLHEASASVIAEALQRNTSLTCINLELNSLDVKALVKVNQLLARNAKIRERALPDVYRARIAQLQGFEREAEILQTVLRRNHFRKRVALWKQAAKCQELIDTKEQEKIRQQKDDARIEELSHAAANVEEEIQQLDAKLWQLRLDGDFETQQLRHKIQTVEDKIKVKEKNLQKSRQDMEIFESQSSAELQALHEELDRALKGENSAALLASTAQRNLDSFSASLKAVMEDVAGGDDPRQRFKEQKESAKSGKDKRGARPRSARPHSARRK